jgi:hypothetical protein
MLVVGLDIDCAIECDANSLALELTRISARAEC